MGGVVGGGLGGGNSTSVAVAENNKCVVMISISLYWIADAQRLLLKCSGLSTLF